MNTDKSSELEMLIAIKYGPISPSMEWFNRLPNDIIETAFNRLNNKYPERSRITFKAQTLSIMLRQPLNKQRTEEAIINSLIEYHCHEHR